MLDAARRIEAHAAPGAIRFTIASLVTNEAQYRAMLASFRDNGFGRPDCEFLFVDNRKSNAMCAYRGLNRLLDEARGDYVILCHQDLLLIDSRDTLERCLSDLDARDPMWAVAGNAGGAGIGEFAMRISDPHGANRHVGTLPRQVHSLDENFIVVKRAARIAPSADLKGFHFYGTDICIQAEVRGFNSYVIDFHLMHLGRGLIDQSFHDCQRDITAKYARAFRPRWIQTTCARVYVSGQHAGSQAAAYWKLAVKAVPRRIERLKSKAKWPLAASPSTTGK